MPRTPHSGPPFGTDPWGTTPFGITPSGDTLSGTPWVFPLRKNAIAQWYCTQHANIQQTRAACWPIGGHNTLSILAYYRMSWKATTSIIQSTISSVNLFWKLNQRTIMESLITKIQQEAASASYIDRKKLLDSLRDLQYSIKPPEDTMQRLLHLVCFPNLRLRPQFCQIRKFRPML